jgi:hypothetical protein
MAAIRSLLNPLPDANEQSVQLPSPSPTVYTQDFSPPPSSRKKQKLSKDAAVFTRGTIRGECRYPPCENRDEVLAVHHQQFEIHPMGHIADYPRHIPYNSEKKSFLNNTGRESFEGMSGLYEDHAGRSLHFPQYSNTLSRYQAMKKHTA